VEQHRNQLTGICIDLVGEILNAGTATQTQNGIAISAWNYGSTKRRCSSLLVFFTLCALRLAGLAALAAALTKGTGGTATDTAAAAATRTGTRARWEVTSTSWRTTRTRSAATETRTRCTCTCRQDAERRRHLPDVDHPDEEHHYEMEQKDCFRPDARPDEEYPYPGSQRKGYYPGVEFQELEKGGLA
jgi:hypothetical protein